MLIFINILLLILKIIGIIILIILGLILGIMAIFLFVPIKYDGNGSYNEDIKLYFSITWLLKMFRFEYILDGEDSQCNIKLPFGLERLLNDDDSPDDDSTYNEDYEPEYEGVPLDESIEETKEIKEEKKADTPPIKQKKIENEVQPKKDELKEIIQDDFYEYDSVEKKSLSEKYSDINEKIQSLIGNIKDKKEFINKKIDFLKNIDEKYDIKVIIHHTILLLKKIFIGLGLKLFQICGIIGLDDPCTTGQVIGAISVFSSILPFDIDIEGDFENSVIEGTVEISGKMRMCNFLFPIIKYLITKPMRTVVVDYLKGAIK